MKMKFFKEGTLLYYYRDTSLPFGVAHIMSIFAPELAARKRDKTKVSEIYKFCWFDRSDT